MTWRWSERSRGVFGLLACLVLATVIAVAVPDPATDVRRRFADAPVGEFATTAVVRARVTQVVLTPSVQGDYGDPWVSDQTLVVTSVEAQVRQRVTQFSRVVLRTSDGHDYKPRTEFISAALGQTQPGFTRHATLVFELPPDRVPGAELVIDADGAAFDFYAAAIRVDLGLRDPVTVAPGPVTLPPSVVTTT